VLKLEKNLPYIVVLILATSIIFLSQILSDELRINILSIFRTPLKIISGSYYALRDISNFKELERENKILKENIENLERELLKLQESRLENERLRALLGFTESNKPRFIPAMVIAKDPLDLKDIIIIDKGKKHNVHKDMVVISGNGLVGRVRESGWGIARVLLITDRDSVVSGIVQRTRDQGAVVGNGCSGLIMKYLELDSSVAKGDKIITSGFGSLFEKGIMIGEVVSVTRDESGLYSNAIIKPEVDMTRIEEVFVMR
jgi:rod shape-determining protein MreC